MKKFKIRYLLKPYFLVPLCIVAVMLLSFLLWFLMPAKTLRIAIVDKTVPATAADNASYLDNVSNNYRKHIGLNWLLDYMKIKNPDTKNYYNSASDYYGPKINNNNEITESNSIADISEVPDMLYLSDTYGVEIYDDHGITEDEINAISMCHSAGSVVIGEQDILTTATDASVRAQLEKLFGMSTTGWVGRYIYDLQDMTDVPYWAPGMWEQKYGQEWKCSGPGILLVSRDGDIIVLEEKTDFQSSSLMKISVNDKFKSEFGKHSMNFYNWFELIEADYNTDVIAIFSFNLNSTGAEEMAAVSNTTTFAAVTRKRVENQADTYYFAGDFNDYVTNLQIHNFLFADNFFRMFSFDRDGDVTNFYWNFYEPVMKKIIKDIEKNPVSKEETQSEQNSRVNGGNMQVMVDGAWQDLNIKGFNINGEMPGNSEYSYSRNYDSYVSLVSSVVNMNGNCIRTYDLLPPEFYRALYENNKNSDKPVYLIQGIMTPTNIKPAETISQMDEIKKNISATLSAVRGNGEVKGYGSRETTSYSYDVSKYIISYLIDPRINGAASDAIMKGSSKAYIYSGQYISSSRNAIEALSAEMCDYTLKAQKDTYGYMIPVSISYGAERLEGASWTAELPYTYNISKLNTADSAAQLFYASYKLQPYDDAVINGGNTLLNYTDASGSFAYGGYIRAVKTLCSSPVLIDKVGYSTNTNMFEKETSINGLSETKQGEAIVRALKAIDGEGYMGALISDLNDNWSAVSSEMSPFVIPASNSGLWQNTADRAQTTGIVAADSKLPSEVAMELNDSGAMQQMQLSTNETYVYITLLLKNEINYDEREMILGIDSYQRNNGEYYYDKSYYANSLSGMEYIVKFESKSSAALYVTKSYNRNTGNYSSKEGYSAAYDLVSVLNYGDFSTSNTHFYQTGMTIRIRIPWAMLNFTDPSSRLVLNGFENNAARTTATEGMIFSLLIGDKNTMDTAYIFPESKQQAGYKTLKLSNWDKTTVSYSLREKASAGIIKRYFDSLK